MSPYHYHKIIVIRKFGVCFTIVLLSVGLCLTAYVTFFLCGLCNVVLLLV